MGIVRNLGLAVYPYMPHVLKNFVCSYEGYRLRQLRLKGKYGETLDWLKNSQWWSLEQQHDYQLQRLCRMLEFAEKSSPYYRELFHSIGLVSRDVQSLDDLKKIPILKKSDIKKNNKIFFNESVSKGDLVTYRTSGTTGTPLELLTTRSCIQTYFAVAGRQRSWFGVDNEMAHATFNGRFIVPRSQNRPPFWCQNWGGKQTLFSIYHMKPANLKAYAEELARFPRAYLSGYPSSLHIMAAYLLDRQIELPWRPEVIFTSSETLLESQRQVISQAFQAPVADYYGMGEQCVSASQCPHGGLHFDFEVGIVELVPVGGDSLVGRIVCTGLINEAMPLIRYDTQDIVRLSEKDCPCGRKGLVAEAIDGRIDSYIKTPEGFLIGRVAHMYTGLPGVQEGQVIQVAIDELIVKIVKAPTFSHEDEKQLLKVLRDRVGDKMKIQVKYVEQIPRENNGKFRAVISRLTDEERSLNEGDFENK